jgi:cyanophycinase
MHTGQARIWLTIAMMGATATAAQTPRVGPERGTVMAIGGGSLTGAIYRRFIAAAGGRASLIVEVPTAADPRAVSATSEVVRSLRRAGADSVIVLNIRDVATANSPAVVSVLNAARGVWFQGGREYRLIDALAGTAAALAIDRVLKRGGVVAGSSAGASVLGDLLIRGGHSTERIVDPTYSRGFGYLRNVAIDQHAIARRRLRDLADSVLPRHPQVLGLSVDEGTGWVVRGDTAEVIGVGHAFVYGGLNADPGKPFLTLLPGDSYDLRWRAIRSRAADRFNLNRAMIDSLLSRETAPLGRTCLLVARQGIVLMETSIGVAEDSNYLPGTTTARFALGPISTAFSSVLTQMDGEAARRAGPAIFRDFVRRRLLDVIGAQRTDIDSNFEAVSTVDDLYRLELVLEDDADLGSIGRPIRGDLGWTSDDFRGTKRRALFSASGATRGAFVRLPSFGVTVILLSDGIQDPRRVIDALLRRVLPRLFAHEAVPMPDDPHKRNSTVS